MAQNLWQKVKDPKTGLWAFQKVENFNRGVSYLAGLDKFDRALAKVGKKIGTDRSVDAWKLLANKADIDTLSIPEQEVLQKMWDAGEPIEKLRHTYSQGIVDDTQFMQLTPERAKMLQTKLGRTALGMGGWSRRWLRYMARMRSRPSQEAGPARDVGRIKPCDSWNLRRDGQGVRR
jgi:hypothetical protein